MKLKLCFLLCLCLNIRVVAQENIIARGLQPGQLVPVSAGLSAFKGKLLIIDFWATWCSPCRTMLPVGDSLNQVFAGKAVILPVTYEKEKIAGPVLRSILSKGGTSTRAGVYADTILQRLFPHQVIPHYVWVDPSGRVRAITEAPAINGFAIRTALGGTYPSAQKQDLKIPYNPARPLFAAGNGGAGEALRYHSLLSGYVPGLRSGNSISAYDSVRGQLFSARNISALWLFRMAYGEGGRWFPPARIINHSQDSLTLETSVSGQAFEQWLASGKGYCYELLLPPSMARQAYPLMQADMQRLFPQYRLSVETIKTRCLALVKTGSEEQFRSKGGPYLVQVTPFKCTLQQATLKQMMLRLEHQYLQNSPIPLVDETGYTGRADLSFNANMSSLPDVNAGLAPYGLQLVEKTAEVEVLLIRDNPLYTFKP